MLELKDKITEQPSHYDNLERMSVGELLQHINQEDMLAAETVHKVLAYSPTADDTVLGIAASGTTPYVIGAVSEARKNGLLTGCITSNPKRLWLLPRNIPSRPS